MPNLGYPTTESLLDSLKSYIKSNLKDSQKIISTVKSGLIDIRDEKPMVTVLPLLEVVRRYYNEGLFDIERTFRLDIIVSGYSTDEVKDALRKKIIALRNLFSTEDLAWNLEKDGNLQVYNFELDSEILSEPENENNGYTQFCTIPLRLRSYFKAINMVVPSMMIESDYNQLLDYLYTEAKSAFTFSHNFWRNNFKPSFLSSLPTLGIFLEFPDKEKDRQTSTEFTDLNVIFRIHSSLATKEIAFLNHLRNVETVKTWILNRPSLDGRVDEFKLFSIDYGIETFPTPFQGAAEEFPVFRSDLTTLASLIQFKEA